MIRSLLLVALVAAASAATTASSGTPAPTPSVTLSCFNADITGIASGSICSGVSGSAGFCTLSQALANTAATSMAASYSLWTTATATATGNVTCALLAGTPNTNWWTSADRCMKPSCPSTCGQTMAPGSTPSTAAYCCSYYKSLANTACTGVAVDTLITPSANAATLAGVGAIWAVSTGGSGSGSAGACSNDSNCISAAQPVAYSALLALLVVLLALARL